jgi:hypothetical protein
MQCKNVMQKYIAKLQCKNTMKNVVQNLFFFYSNILWLVFKLLLSLGLDYHILFFEPSQQGILITGES